MGTKELKRKGYSAPLPAAVESDEEDDRCETDEEILQGFREAVEEYHAMQRGEIPKGQDLRDILKEMKAERLAAAV